ncbi:RNA recognition motif domain-containing protein [Puia sp. P3]|uniref:RNA recognition motif domain-containing protein n=1 Tax=Puia sp. P3 TaxID=3423952 RepID=UPI003D66BDE3
MTDEDLRNLFEQHGSVSSAKIVKDKVSGRSKGFGFVEMEDDAEAQQAITNLYDSEVMGRKIIVNESQPKQQSSGGGGGGYKRGPSAAVAAEEVTRKVVMTAAAVVATTGIINSNQSIHLCLVKSFPAIGKDFLFSLMSVDAGVGLMQFPDLDTAKVDEVPVVLQQDMSLRSFSKILPDLVFAYSYEVFECL